MPRHGFDPGRWASGPLPRLRLVEGRTGWDPPGSASRVVVGAAGVGDWDTRVYGDGHTLGSGVNAGRGQESVHRAVRGEPGCRRGRGRVAREPTPFVNLYSRARCGVGGEVLLSPPPTFKGFATGRLRGSASSACARSTQKWQDKAQCSPEIRFTDGGHTAVWRARESSDFPDDTGVRGPQRGHECSVQAPPGSAVETRSRPHLEGTRHQPPRVGTCPAVGVDTPPNVREVVVKPEVSICLQALETASTFGSVF